MAKVQSKKKAVVRVAELPQRENYIILFIGIAVIVLGYIVMAAGDATSPLSVTIAPLILVLGYCVIVPFGILYRRKSATRQ